jgi:phosphatidylglycerophosphate synthase
VKTLYDLKPRFQQRLGPIVRGVAALGITANQVTLGACALSIAIGVAVAANAAQRTVLLLIPLACALRMPLNAIDGLLARDFRQRTLLGVYLNELCDVVADAALYLPFALVAPFSSWSVGLVVLLAALSELAGALGPMIGTGRRNDGPLGKSDRAVVFGALGLWIGVGLPLPESAAWIMPAVAALTCLTVLNRVRGGIRAAERSLESGAMRSVRAAPSRRSP